MRYLFIAIIYLLLAGINQPAICGQPATDISLYKTLLYNKTPEYSPAKLNINEYPKEYHARLLEYIKRWKNFKSKMTNPKGPWERQMAFEKQIQVERGIVSLINTKGIEDLAAEYASNASIGYEWEGMSDGPFGEAEDAEAYLNSNPQSPLKPYLVLFLLHRYRIAFECFGFEKNAARQAMASNKYREYLKTAMADKDPLIALIASDIDKQSYLYVKTERHP
jgi:hypothetical protein